VPGSPEIRKALFQQASDQDPQSDATGMQTSDEMTHPVRTKEGIDEPSHDANPASARAEPHSPACNNSAATVHSTLPGPSKNDDANDQKKTSVPAVESSSPSHPNSVPDLASQRAEAGLATDASSSLDDISREKQLHGQVKTLEQELERVKAESNHQATRANEAEKLVMDLEMVKRGQRQGVESHQRELTKLRQRAEEAESRAAEMQQQFETFRLELKQMHLENEGLEHHVAELEENNSKVDGYDSSRIDELEQMVSELRQDRSHAYTQLDLERKQTQQEIEQAVSQARQHLEQEFKQADDERRSTLSKEMETLIARVDDLQTKLRQE